MDLFTLVLAFVAGAFFVLMLLSFLKVKESASFGRRSLKPGENPLCYLD